MGPPWLVAKVPDAHAFRPWSGARLHDMVVEVPAVSFSLSRAGRVALLLFGWLTVRILNLKEELLENFLPW